MIRKILSPVNQVITCIQDWADEKTPPPVRAHDTRNKVGGNTDYVPVLQRAIHLLYGIIHLPDRQRGWRNHTNRAHQAVAATK